MIKKNIKNDFSNIMVGTEIAIAAKSGRNTHYTLSTVTDVTNHIFIASKWKFSKQTGKALYVSKTVCVSAFIPNKSQRDSIIAENEHQRLISEVNELMHDNLKMASDSDLKMIRYILSKYH